MFRSFRKPYRGFTVIELLVVIVIIGILAAVAVPRFMAAQDRGRVMLAGDDLGQLRRELAEYHAKNGTYPTDVDLIVDPVVRLKGEWTMNDSTYSFEVKASSFLKFKYVPVPGYDTNGLGYVPDSYKVEVMCLNRARTTLAATPEGLFRDGRLIPAGTFPR